MTLGQFLLSLWSALFIWYVVERLRVAKGRLPEPPLRRHPIAAGRRFWRALWDSRAVGLGATASIAGAYTVVCLGIFLWTCIQQGFPRGLSAGPMTKLIHVRLPELGRLVSAPQFWSLTWRELLDAATLYPAFRLGLASLPIAGIVLALLLLWMVRHSRDLHSLASRKLPPDLFNEAYGYIGTGLLALMILGTLRLEAGATPASDIRLFAGFLSLLAVPVVHGGVLGLVTLAAADVVAALPLDVCVILRRWVRLLPGFVLLAGVVVLPRVVADVALPEWETDRATASGGVAGVLWIITRLTWVAVLPVWLRMALTRRRLREVMAEGVRFWPENWRTVGVAMARAPVILAPMLLAVTLLETVAPASALVPGLLTVLGSWAVGLLTLGGTLVVYRDLCAGG